MYVATDSRKFVKKVVLNVNTGPLVFITQAGEGNIQTLRMGYSHRKRLLLASKVQQVLWGSRI